MKAIVAVPGSKNTVRLQEVEKPIRESDQALLKVIRVGVDGTDIEINSGAYGETPVGSNYLILGHECLAIVEETSEKTSKIRKGDLVVPTVRRPDDCANCLADESDMCLTGNYKEHGIKGLHGFAAEYAVTDANFLVKIPQELEHVGVLLEPISIAEKAVLQTYRIQERMLWKPKRALVLGVGPLGLIATYLLRLKGLQVFSVARRSRESLKAKLVERAGAIYVNSKEQSLESLGKFDIVLEITGAPSLAMEGQELLNPNGVMCMIGIYTSKEISKDIGQLYTSLVLGN
ncbi:MAG: glucose 1-dehydrogenase, partial [Candidatus Bathyarchaeia archaeon]